MLREVIAPCTCFACRDFYLIVSVKAAYMKQRSAENMCGLLATFIVMLTSVTSANGIFAINKFKKHGGLYECMVRSPPLTSWL